MVFDTKSQPQPRPSRLASLSLAGAAGFAWGVSLAHMLSEALHRFAFRGILGTGTLALVCAVAAIVLAQALLRQRDQAPHAIARFVPLFLPLLDLVGPRHVPWRGPLLLGGSMVAALLTLVRLPPWAWTTAAFVVPLVVYLPDVSPYVGRADTFEFQVIGPQLGVAHPSGYPLYTLICKLFSWIPIGPVAWRVNLSSAVFSALAACSLYLALMAAWPKAPHRRPLAFFSALMLAFSPTLWSRAIEAEVYALNAWLVAAFVWLSVRWQTSDLAPRRAVPALGLLLGLALSSHITLGALLFFVGAGLAARWLRPGAAVGLLTAVLFLLGLSLYAYIPLRWPAVTGGERMSVAAFVRFVTNADSGGALRPLAFLRDPARWSVVGRLLLAQSGWAGLSLAVLGLLWLLRRQPLLGVGMALACSAWIWFGLSFYVAEPDFSAFLIPGHVMMIAWLGCGAFALQHRLGNRLPWARHVVYGLVGLLVMSSVWRTGPTLRTVEQGRSDEAWARYALSQPLKRDAAVLADSEKFPPLYYLQQVEAVRPDLDLVTKFSEAQYRVALESRLGVGQTVYLARYLPGMDAFGVTSVGPLVQVGARTAGDHAGTPRASFGDALGLLGYSLAADAFLRPMHHLTLTWQATSLEMDDLEVRLRAVRAEDGEEVWQSSGARPVSGYSSTEAWSLGTVVDDYHPVSWPPWLPGGTYELQVAVYPRFGDVAVPYDDRGRTWFPLAPVVVPEQMPDVTGEPLSSLVVLGRRAASRDRPALPGTLEGLTGGTAWWLLGAGVPGEVPAAGARDLDLTWLCAKARTDPAEVVPLAVTWLSAGGDAYATQPLCALGLGVALPRCGSGQGDGLMLRYPIRAPATPGRYTLALEVAQSERTVASDVPRLQCGWLSRRSSLCPLADVQVVPEDASLADFDSRLLLLDARLDASQLVAGGQLEVDLTWRARREISRDYTVFVQALGPDGKLYGQVDSWPVQGTRPTSGWRVGEEIQDPYRFYLQADAPTGQYQVIVGWYLLADMTRLRVIDEAGAAVGDYYELGTFTLP